MNKSNMESAEQNENGKKHELDPFFEETLDNNSSSVADEEINKVESEDNKKFLHYLFVAAMILMPVLWFFSGSIKEYLTHPSTQTEHQEENNQIAGKPVILREKFIGSNAGDAVKAISFSGNETADKSDIVTLTESGEIKILDEQWNIIADFKSPEDTKEADSPLSEKTISFAVGAKDVILSGSENGKVNQYINSGQGWIKQELFTFRDDSPGLDPLVATGTITHILLTRDKSRGVFFNYDGQGIIISKSNRGYSPAGKISLSAGLAAGGYDASGKLWTLARDGTFSLFDLMNPQNPLITFGVGDFAFIYGADWNGQQLTVCGDNPDSQVPVVGVYASNGKAEKLLRAPSFGEIKFNYQNIRVPQSESIVTINQPGNYFAQVSWLDNNRVGAVYQNTFTVFELKQNKLQQFAFTLAPEEHLIGFLKRTNTKLVFNTDRGRVIDAEINTLQ